ncbi:reverse transcriptase family protein [Aliarcobacter butzleri]|uniref:reverse transcriptase family protein n=1 Tax=Aliarcobacter butzleri TaxID=28197 RepID=UPI0012605E05|nr:reverse transcriptase family protein [Aliarcobacter butzleri]MCT7624923.1 reverse transcriptase family protein [Aliarcobacter butzleri]MCT7644598.1 reverse transcriptase family protein [Aliarcobacter butzleri]
MNSFRDTYLYNYKDTLDEIISKIKDFLLTETYKKIFKDEDKLQYINHFTFLDILSNTKKFYTKRIIYTNKKERIVFEPSVELYLIQKFILYNYLIQRDSSLSENLTSYRKNYSVKNNAIKHINKRTIIKIDIKNFFPTINRYRIYKCLLNLNIEEKKAYLFSRLLSYQDKLILGTPSSPFLSNLVSRKLDLRIEGYIKAYQKSKVHISYTRYSDDMTFSFNQRINTQKFISFIYQIILDEGFVPNYEKTQIISSNHKQKVTGIIVNRDTMSVSKKERDDVEFIIKLWLNYSKDIALQKYNKIFKKNYTNERDFHQILKSKILYIKFINDEQGKKLIRKFEEIKIG